LAYNPEGHISPKALHVMLLRKVKFPQLSIAVNVEPKIVTSCTRIGTFKLLVETVFEVVQSKSIVACNEPIVDM